MEYIFDTAHLSNYTTHFKRKRAGIVLNFNKNCVGWLEVVCEKDESRHFTCQKFNHKNTEEIAKIAGSISQSYWTRFKTLTEKQGENKSKLQGRTIC